MSNSFDFEEFKAQAIEKLKAGVPLFGIDRSIYLFKREFAERCIKEWLEYMNSL